MAQHEMIEPMCRVQTVRALDCDAVYATEFMRLTRCCVDEHYTCLKSLRNHRN
jgi:hypothetical protein